MSDDRPDGFPADTKGGNSDAGQREVTPADFEVLTFDEIRQDPGTVDPAMLREPSFDDIEMMRQQVNLSQTELAREAGITPSTYSQWVSGGISPSSDSAARILRVLEDNWPSA